MLMDNKLNKVTEVLWCATSRRQHQIPQEATRVGNDFVQTAGWVRNLGNYLDSEASMKIRVSRTVSSCFSVLRHSGLFGDPSRVQSYSRSSCHWCCHDSTTAT